MKTTKRRFEFFTFYDHTGIARHLERMAQKGWLLQGIHGNLWSYRTIAPTKLAFTVTYYPDASAFDPEPSEGELCFRDFCAHTGWQLAASSAQLQIFYNDRTDPIPIETDPNLEIETIHRYAGKTILLPYSLLLFIGLLSTFFFVSRLLGDPIGLLASSTNLFTGYVWCLELLLCVTELGGYFRWRHRAKKAAVRGEFLDTRGHSLLQSVILIAALAGFVLWLLSVLLTETILIKATVLFTYGWMVGLALLLWGILRLLKRWKVSKDFSRIIYIIATLLLTFCMVGVIFWVGGSGYLPEPETYTYQGSELALYLDELPLTVEDLQPISSDDSDDYIRRRSASQSPLLARFDMEQRPRLDAEEDLPRLEYTITLVKVSSLYDLCRNQLLKYWNETENIGVPEGHRTSYEARDAAPWGALDAYQVVSEDCGPRERYLLCYEDRFVEIFFDWAPTADQMAQVGTVLGQGQV